MTNNRILFEIMFIISLFIIAAQEIIATRQFGGNFDIKSNPGTGILIIILVLFAVKFFNFFIALLASRKNNKIAKIYISLYVLYTVFSAFYVSIYAPESADMPIILGFLAALFQALSLYFLLTGSNGPQKKRTR